MLRAMKQAQPNDAIFEIEGETVIPSELAGGPWSPDAQHGGAVAGLLARAAERSPTPVPMRVARLSIDLMRAVPLHPMRIETNVVRAGRRIHGVDVALLDGETCVARASALLMQTDETHAALATPGRTGMGAPPEVVNNPLGDGAMPEWMPGFIRAVDYVGGLAKTTGEPHRLWARLRCKLVAGEEPSPLVRLAAMSDFTSGAGNALDYMRYTSINPDLTLYIGRDPVGEWIGLESTTWLGSQGTGQSLATLFDATGPIGTAQTSLLLGRR